MRDVQDLARPRPAARAAVAAQCTTHPETLSTSSESASRARSAAPPPHHAPTYSTAPRAPPPTPAPPPKRRRVRLPPPARCAGAPADRQNGKPHTTSEPHF